MKRILAPFVALVSALALAGPFAIVGGSGSAGAGTVTSVNVTPANGISCVVTDPTGDADLSCALGAITPISVSTGTMTASRIVGTLTAVTGTLTGTVTGNITGNAATVTTNANLTGPITSTGNATALAAQTGTGSIFVVQSSPTINTPTLNTATFVAPALGTPSSGVLTNGTGLPVSTGVSGLGTGVAAALGVNTGTAGSHVVNGGDLGTPSAGVATNLTGTATGLTANTATAAVSAAALTTGRSIGITGDLTYTSPSFNGSGNVTAAGTLATVNSNTGTFTASTITVNAKGLITAASSGAAAGDVSGPASSTNTALARFSGTGGKTLLDSTGVTSDGSSVTIASGGKLHANAADTVVAVDFGGTTASVPALRRNGAALEAVLGDASNFAAFKAAGITSSTGALVLSSTATQLGNLSGDISLSNGTNHIPLRADMVKLMGASNTTVDLAVSRNAAGVAEINNGTLGTYRDLNLRTVTGTGTATFSARVTGHSGSATVPGIALDDSSGMGLSFYTGIGGMGFTDQGLTRAWVTGVNGQFGVYSSGRFMFGSGSSPANNFDTGISRAAAGKLQVDNGSSTLSDISFRQLYPDFTNTATVGAVTINKSAGKAIVGSGTTSTVVTNSLVTANSQVMCTVNTNDATAALKNCVPAAGSFTITVTAAATADTNVAFIVFNQ